MHPWTDYEMDGQSDFSNTHFLIMLYLSVKFYRICFSSFLIMAETRFVTD